jgi:hypothetical protein
MADILSDGRFVLGAGSDYLKMSSKDSMSTQLKNAIVSTSASQSWSGFCLAKG